MELFLRNASASDPGTARQLSETSGSGNVTLTSPMLGSSYSTVWTFVTDGYGGKIFEAGNWVFTLRTRLDPSEDTFADETRIRVRLYRRRDGSNTLLGTSATPFVNGTSFVDRNYTISLGEQTFIDGDEVFLEIQASDEFSDTQVQINIENSSNQSGIDHPDFDLIISTETVDHTTDSLKWQEQELSHTINSLIQSITQITHSVDTVLYILIGTPIWISPEDQVQDVLPDEPLVFEIPDSQFPLHFEMQIDSSNEFNTGDLIVRNSYYSQTGWEYFDGDNWESIPPSGVPVEYSGNQARFTPESLTEGVWYRRIRAIGVES